MPRAKELKVRVQNHPGMLGKVALALSAQKVNVRAANAWVEGGEGVIRIVAEPLPAARKALTRGGWKPDEEDVLEAELSDKPGELARLAAALGEAGVDITHLFVGTAAGRKAAVFLGVSDLKAALRVAARVLR
jgi:hypothetical protein